ncbi:MAG: HPr kinase/phosphorylase [Caulobacter sp.]|nr:HPr kinase/phosphorylase [Caulobacter sp.]
MIRHAGLIARRVAGTWRGALIEGPSGVGKSDLALRALDQGFVLVADDRVLVFVSGGELYGRAPDSLSGLVEARGLGVLSEPSRPFVRIDLLVRCVDRPQAVERLPDPMFEVIEGVSIKVLDLWPLEPGAPGKIRRMFEHLGVAD